MYIIESNVPRLRDPFVLAENGTYYMYGTGWVCYKSTGDLTKWEKVENRIVIEPEGFVKCDWAPEVHKYNDAYYMFTTYYSLKTEHRGSTILKSLSPEGPFEEITNGHITPLEWDCIDATLYVDEANNPWMIFVHEWTSTEDNVGRMAAARLSEDLTHFVSEPVELFRADDPTWTKHNVTDGCFMYKTSDGRLLMIWSNFAGAEGEQGYAVGMAYSENGKPDGKWIHCENLLYSTALSGGYDGGHGMIFNGFDGKKYLSIHSPNTPDEKNGRMEMPVFIPVHEENGTLVCE